MDGFSVVESASAQLQNAQLNFCKAEDIISCAKASITSEGMMPDLIAYGGVEFRMLHKRTMLLMIQNCQDHEKL